MQKHFLSILFCFSVSLFLLSSSVQAMTVKQGKDVTVSSGSVVNGTLFVTGNSIRIDDAVDGDIICAGQSVQINSEVNGDVICAAQTLVVNGKVNGNIRLAGQTLRVNSTVQRNASLFGQQIDIDKSSSISGELMVFGQNANIDGVVDKEAFGAGSRITIDGLVGNGVNFSADELSIGKDAQITGNVRYTSAQEAFIAKNSIINGQVIRSEPPPNQAKRYERNPQENWIGKLLGSIIFHTLVGLALVFFFASKIKEIIQLVEKRPLPLLGWGLVVLICTPFVFLLILLTIIGIPIAIILLMVYIIALFCSKILVGIWLGQKVTNQYWQTKKDSLFTAALIGIPLLWLITAIPVIGWLFSFIAVFIGLGGIFLVFKPTGKKAKE